jgi:DNA-binding winged helix-turn-helix (wHTH) protein/tetratricopeptide (TPR) repeat protein
MSSIQMIEPGVIYRFDRFELFPEAEQLRKHGALIRLAPQPFRVLLLLVSRAGRIVTREEIQEELWGSGTFVDFEQGINAVIRRIRFALNDQAETPRFLQTQPRRGYCFVAPVERIVSGESRRSLEAVAPAPEADSDPPMPVVPDLPVALPLPDLPLPASSRVSRVGRAAMFAVMASTLLATSGPQFTPSAGTPVPRVLRVAVSPVAFDGQRLEAESHRLSAELRRKLAEIQPERIRLAEPGTPADLRIDSTLRVVADGMRLDARLTETSTGRQLWSETFRPSGETGAFPGDFPLEVALHTTRALAEKYLPSPRRNPVVVRSRVSQPALAYYREGLATRSQAVPQRDLDRAVELLEKAVALEPRFSEAWAAIGDIWTERTLLWMGGSRRTAVTQARIALDRALVLDPHCAEALNDRALLLISFERSYVEAETEFRKALAVEPAYIDAHCNLALLLAAMGKHDEAIAEMKRVQLLDPASYKPSPIVAHIHLMARHFDDAQAEYRESVLAYPDPASAHWGMLSSAIGAGRWDDAATSLSALLGERVEIPANAGDRGAVLRRELRRFVPKFVEKERNNQLDPYATACLHAQTGDADLAFAALDRAIAGQSFYLMFAFVDPRLDSIRGDPRFVDHLDQVGLIR